MSGGQLDYSYSKIDFIIQELQAQKEIESDYINIVKPEIEILINQLENISNNLWHLEWYLSGDISHEQMQRDWK